MDPFVAHMAAFCTERDLIRPGDHVLVALSGGPDSMGLLHGLVELGSRWSLRLAAAHFNHALRGEASDREAAFAARTAKALGLPYFEDKQDVRAYKKARGLSTQEAARDLRYEFLESVRERLGARSIAMGHTADDQIEEILLRLLRGVGPDGLKGMPAKRDAVIRPLLSHAKASVLDYLERNRIPHAVDGSNAEPLYLRNRVRIELVPKLEELARRTGDHLLALASMSEEDAAYFQNELDRTWATLVRYRDDRVLVLDRADLSRLPASLAARAVRRALSKIRGDAGQVTYGHLRRILELAAGPHANAHLDLPGPVRVDVAYQGVAVGADPAYETPFHLTVDGPGTFSIPQIRCELALAVQDRRGEDEDPWTVWMDAAQLRFPLDVRSYRPGDRLRPAGLGGSKKLKDAFMDRKVPRWLRKAYPVLCSGDRVVWVPGVAIGEECARDSGSGYVRGRLSGWLPNLVGSKKKLNLNR